MSASLEQVYTYHAPNAEQIKKYDEIRKSALKFAKLLKKNCPSSCEHNIAQNKLKECVMWANSSIAINESEQLTEN